MENINLKGVKNKSKSELEREDWKENYDEMGK